MIGYILIIASFVLCSWINSQLYKHIIILNKALDIACDWVKDGVAIGMYDKNATVDEIKSIAIKEAKNV